MRGSISPDRAPDNEAGGAAGARGEVVRREARVPAEFGGQRLDQALANLFPEYSRARLQRWIRDGAVRLDDAVRRPRDRVAGGEAVRLEAVLQAEGDWQPQAVTALDLVWSDEHLMVVAKPPGLVVHPGAGNRDGTLVNALLHLAPDLAAVPRAGIVHRLDKDTSGLLVVARSLAAHTALVRALKRHEVSREYLALVVGTMPAGGSVDAPVGRHRMARVRMAVREDGRRAVTHYRVAERFRHHTLLDVALETGRTHQIRVHMSHIGHALVGDPVYGGRLRLPPGASERLRAALAGFPRQALHARRLALAHPLSGEPLTFEREAPPDLQGLLDVLREEDPCP